ncbi:MAG TPA: ribonuclease P protein component [Nevskia sp.]|jgi:ribonuclease P protein component|nr:ribonuclease P protein component [Nevskia sp.]
MHEGAALQRAVRIRQPADFKQAFAQGFRITRAPLAAVCRPDNGLGHPRLGLAIARKAAPRAVDRNRIKRLIREHFRHNQRRLPAVDLVFYGMAGLADADNQRLRALLAEIWLKVIDRCGGSSQQLSAPTSA